MRSRIQKINPQVVAQIIDLFEYSPMSVTEIAAQYGLNRLAVYRIMWRKEGRIDSSQRKVNGPLIKS